MYETSSSNYTLTNRSDLLEVIPLVDIVGTAEVATILRCPKQQIHSLRKRSDFPKPLLTLASTPIWNANDIKSFGKTWSRRIQTP